ncbi:MAG: thymidylate kinase [Planctomycetaceae bacterium]
MGLLVAIEGIDGTGKGTQARHLADRLTAAGHSTQLIGFPRYSETAFGKRIGEFLNGRYGALDAVHPLLVSLLFAGDRFESLERLQDAIDDCDVVVLDRYVASNIAHQAAKLHGLERHELKSFIEHLEYRIYRLPPADLVVLLDLPAAVAQTLIANKQQRDYTDKQKDLQETDVAYQESVRQLYLELAATQPTWRRVDVAPGNNLRHIDDIAAEVYDVVRTRLAGVRKV